jgi:hypothetical protein
MAFKVHNVDVSELQMPAISQKDLAKAWSSFGNLIACSHLDTDFPSVSRFGRPSLLAAAVYDAFYQHFSLKLSPDVIWLTIIQSFARYVNNNAELLRSKFVDFEGKKGLVINRPSWTKGNPANDWSSAFPEFGAQIESFVGSKIADFVRCNFTTTTDVTRLCSEIALMDACQHYFSYDGMCGCGIPSIELLGSVEDWRFLRRKIGQFDEFVLEEDSTKSDIEAFESWIVDLRSVADHFVAGSEGHLGLHSGALSVI